MRNDFNLAVALLADLYCIAQVSYTVFHLNFVMEELLEGGNIKDFV